MKCDTTCLTCNLNALALEPPERGIVVDRRFALDGATVSGTAVGDISSVTVTIAAPTGLYQQCFRFVCHGVTPDGRVMMTCSR
jgi:hypothetical protein